MVHFSKTKKPPYFFKRPKTNKQKIALSTASFQIKTQFNVVIKPLGLKAWV